MATSGVRGWKAFIGEFISLERTGGFILWILVRWGGGGGGVDPVRRQEWYFVIDHCFVAVRQKVKHGKAVRKIENHLILQVGGETEFN